MSFHLQLLFCFSYRTSDYQLPSSNHSFVDDNIDFVSMNQDFQKFVASVGETVNHQATLNTLLAADILPLKPSTGSQSSIEQALGDIVSTIR